MTQSDILNAIQEHLKTLFKEPTPEILSVYEIAKDYYGEDNVDLQPSPEIGYIFYDTYCTWERLSIFLSLSENFLNRITEKRRDWLEYLAANDSELVPAFLEELTYEKLKEQVPYYSIFVKFDNITITNEHDSSQPIEQMFVYIPILDSGKHKFRMRWTRTITSARHTAAGYAHSHLPTISSGVWGGWQNPCLGSGPITMTIESLDSEYDLDLWGLFFLELDKCIRTESLSGGPYIGMSNIVDGQSIERTHTVLSSREQTIEKEQRNQILVRLIKSNKLRFYFDVDRIRIANSFTEFTALASQCALDVIMAQLLSTVPAERLTEDYIRNCLRHHVLGGNLKVGTITPDGRVVYYSSYHSTTADVTSEVPFKFKGEQVYFKVLSNEEDEEIQNLFYLLKADHITYIYNQLEIIANYHYGNFKLRGTSKPQKRRKA